jgi:hypothetical protein
MKLRGANERALIHHIVPCPGWPRVVRDGASVGSPATHRNVGLGVDPPLRSQGVGIRWTAQSAWFLAESSWRSWCGLSPASLGRIPSTAHGAGVRVRSRNTGPTRRSPAVGTTSKVSARSAKGKAECASRFDSVRRQPAPSARLGRRARLRVVNVPRRVGVVRSLHRAEAADMAATALTVARGPTSMERMSSSASAVTAH